MSSVPRPFGLECLLLETGAHRPHSDAGSEPGRHVVHHPRLLALRIHGELARLGRGDHLQRGSAATVGPPRGDRSDHEPGEHQEGPRSGTDEVRRSRACGEGVPHGHLPGVDDLREVG